MPNGKSDQLVSVDASPAGRIEANEAGKIYVQHFSYTVDSATGPAAVGETLEACRVPKGARIMGGSLKTDGLSSGGGTAGADVGDGTTANRFGTALDLDAAGSQVFAEEIADDYGVELSADTSVYLTVTGEDWADGQVIRGEVQYLFLA